MMRYSDVRHQIESGDVLAVHGHGLFPAVIRIIQRLSGAGALAGITHVGIAMWLQGRLYSVEMDGRYNVLRPVSQHIKAGFRVDVYRCPVEYSAILAQFNRAISSPIHYDFIDLLDIGLRMLLRLRSTNAGDGELVCSTYIARWLQWAEWKVSTCFPAKPGPAEVCGELGEPVFMVSGES